MISKLTKIILSLRDLCLSFGYFIYRYNVFLKRKGPQNPCNGLTVGILGNGPTMNVDLEKNQSSIDFFISLNDAPATREFFEIKPKYHFLIDSFFFNGKEKRVRDIKENLEKVDWEIEIVVPMHFYKRAGAIYRTMRVVALPTNELKGFSRIERFMYGKRLGMPRVQNVLVAGLTFAIWNAPKKIVLFGVTHDWVRYMNVQNGKLHLRSHHYFDKNQRSKAWLKPEGGNWRVGEALIAQGLMFRSYDWLAKYIALNKKEITIEILSEDTLIDSFGRNDLL